MADARTILAGGNLINDAYRQRIAAAAAKRERKKSAVREASEAFTGLGEAFKQYGDWQQLKAEEEEQRGIQNDLSLGLSTGGAEGALVALQARKPSTRAGAELLANRIDTLTERVRDQKNDELKRAHEFSIQDRIDQRSKAQIDYWNRRDESRVTEILARNDVEKEERKRAAERNRILQEEIGLFYRAADNGRATEDMAMSIANSQGEFDYRLYDRLSQRLDATGGKRDSAAAYAAHLKVPYFDGMTIPQVLAEWRRQNPTVRRPPLPGEALKHLTPEEKARFDAAQEMIEEWEGLNEIAQADGEALVDLSARYRVITDLSALALQRQAQDAGPATTTLETEAHPSGLSEDDVKRLEDAGYEWDAAAEGWIPPDSE